jgi:hypothetical protein
MAFQPPRRAAIVASLTALAGAGPVSARHVVLLGDSTLDNQAYVDGGPDVASQVRLRLPAGSHCTLAARDGAITRETPSQLAGVSATHLVISVGGNDALRHEAVLGQPCRSVAEGLGLLAEVRAQFQRDYRSMLETVLIPARPTAVCTIYDPGFPDPARQGLAVAGLALFNDVILREAFSRRLTVIDLRLICSSPEDLANPIEPSVAGGAKIAAAIARFVSTPASASVVLTD